MKNSLTNILAGLVFFVAGLVTYHFADHEYSVLSKYFDNKEEISNIKKENRIIKEMNEKVLDSIKNSGESNSNKNNVQELKSQIEMSTDDLLVKIEEVNELTKMSLQQLNDLKKKCQGKTTCRKYKPIIKRKPIVKKKKICNQYWICKKNKAVEWEDICYKDQISIKEKVKVKELTKKYRQNSTEVTEDIVITTIEPEIKRKPKKKMCYEKNKWLISQCKNVCR